MLDFGISKLTGAIAAASGMDMTKTKALLGSPWYMSPEHMRSARTVDARTDIWSMGVILYKLLTGVVPFGGETVGEVFARVLQDQPVRPLTWRPDMPAELEAVILRSLCKDVAQRHQDVGQFAADLVPFGRERGPDSVDRISRILGTTGPQLPVATGQQPVVQTTEPGLGPPSAGVTTPYGKTPLNTPYGQTPPAAVAPNAEPVSVNTPASWGSTGPGVVPKKSAGKGLLIGIAVGAVTALIAVIVFVVRGSSNEPAAAAGTQATSSSTAVAATSSSDPGTQTNETSAVASSSATASAEGADAGAAKPSKKVAHKVKRPKTTATAGTKPGVKKPPPATTATATAPAKTTTPASKPGDDWSRY